MLNDLETNLARVDNEMDLTNQVAYLNQARFEDITMMEYDTGCHHLRSQLENDLEPMNVEMLQELLGAVDPAKNELEAFLNKPFETNLEMQNTDNNLLKNYVNNVEVDLDRFELAHENAAADVEINLVPVTEAHGDLDTSATSIIEAQHVDDFDLIPIGVKASCVIEEVEVNQNLKNNAPIINMIDLNIHERVLHEGRDAPRTTMKRKAMLKPIIIDAATTISHQVIRENMTKKCYGLMDKNALFPNPHIANSLRAQIACSAMNLFEFPGSYTTLRCPKLLRFWMDRKEICKRSKSPFIEHDDLPSKETVSKNQIFPDYSDISIEKVREASSLNFNVPVDSFTFGSDTLQKSIRQSSFDVEKSLDEINQVVPEVNVEQHNNYSSDKSMMPIVEEDLNQRYGICDNNLVPVEHKIVDKGDVWKIIQDLFQAKLAIVKEWNEVKIGFTDICLAHSTKKTAAMVFLVLLRLGKYKKIRLFQEHPTSEIFVRLPEKEV